MCKNRYLHHCLPYWQHVLMITNCVFFKYFKQFTVCTVISNPQWYSLNVKWAERVEKASERVKRRTTYFWLVKLHSKMSVELNFSLHKEWKFWSKLQLSLISDKKHVLRLTPYYVEHRLNLIERKFIRLNEWKFTRLH